VVPTDKFTKENIQKVNRRNLFLLFVLCNLYFFDSW